MGLASFNRLRREQAAKEEAGQAVDKPLIDNKTATRAEDYFNGQLRADDIKHFLDIAGVQYGNKTKKSDLIQLLAKSKHEGVL